MAVLTAGELRNIRNSLERAMNGAAITYTKPQINAATQAIEDRLQNSKATLNNDIEGAAPGVFTVAQKKLIVAYAALRFANAEAV